MLSVYLCEMFNSDIQSVKGNLDSLSAWGRVGMGVRDCGCHSCGLSGSHFGGGAQLVTLLPQDSGRPAGSKSLAAFLFSGDPPSSHLGFQNRRS